MFPAVGHTYESNFNIFVVRLSFESETSMTYTIIKGPNQGMTEHVQTTITPLRPGVFLVSWQEANKTTVSQVEDFEQGVIHSNITTPDGTFYNLSGTWKQVV